MAAISSEMDFRTGSGAQPGAARTLPLPSAALPAPPSSAGSNPLEALAGLGAPTLVISMDAAVGARTELASGVVTIVPSSCRVAALLAQPYMSAILSGKAPVAETTGAFSAAQGQCG